MEIGNILRQARLSKGLTMDQIEEETKIRAKYLDALENEQFDLLPGKVYVIAFMRNYAKYLGLDDEELVRMYKDRERVDADLIQETTQETKGEIKPKKKTGYLPYLVAVVLIAFAFALTSIYHNLTPEPDTARQPGIVQDLNEDQEDDQIIPDPNAGWPGTVPAPDVDVPGQGIELVLNVTDDRCWMQIDVDGETAFTGIASAGDVKEFRGQESIYIVLGNAGVVEVQVNGENLGTLAPRGNTYRNEFTAQQG